MDFEALGIRIPHDGGMVVCANGGIAVAHPGSTPPFRATSLPTAGPSFANMLRRMVSYKCMFYLIDLMATIFF